MKNVKVYSLLMLLVTFVKFDHHHFSEAILRILFQDLPLYVVALVLHILSMIYLQGHKARTLNAVPPLC